MVAQVLGLRLLQGEAEVRSVLIAVDSRSTLEALERTTTGTGEYLLETIRRECAAAIRRTHHRLELEFRWVAGHEGVEGNERVDEEAKAAAKGEHVHKWVTRHIGNPLPISKSAVRTGNRTKMEGWLRKAYEGSKRSDRMVAVGLTLGRAVFVDNTNHLTRRQTSFLIQMGTGHVGLKAYLFWVGKAGTARCGGCREEAETVTHFFFRCRKFVEARRIMRQEVGRRGEELRAILM
ncbi:hypothetical protein FA15DRAFT_596733 [Coprinopsis marcescibilis]|uniref:RNase H type-1 domain-containing protein n=1 Tax=Coprinopsis marcescibilis TaxID=230819 RepID=A0A5C3KNJ1_COPMA|nr:hypothetical protein FA15DRAFT_596733 [Coprinopsis marcescibilis]